MKTPKTVSSRPETKATKKSRFSKAEVSTRTRLARAFRLIAEDDHNGSFSVETSADVLPIARRLLAEFDKGTDSETVERLLAKASDTVFSNCEVLAHTEPTLAQRAGFYTGFALCWLLHEEQQGSVR